MRITVDDLDVYFFVQAKGLCVYDLPLDDVIEEESNVLEWLVFAKV